MKKLTFIALAVLAVSLVVVGCDWIIPTEPETKIEINDNSGDVDVTIDDGDVTIEEDGEGDVTVDQGSGCCDDDDGATQCYSIPSCSPRDCSGCTLGEDCTLDPNDALCTDEE